MHSKLSVSRNLNQGMLAAVCCLFGLANAAAPADPNHAALDFHTSTQTSATQSGSARPKDFIVHYRSDDGSAADSTKFNTFGYRGFVGGVVRWRYDDTNRSAVISPSAASAINTIHSAMNSWSSVCNVSFIYDGTSTAGPSLAPPTSVSDGVTVIGWRSLGASSGITGVTGVSASGPSGGPFTLVEGDIAFNFDYDPVFAQTALHEVGHLLGIEHSNFNNVLMSGEPQSRYGNTATLQQDDIDACVSLYGAPGSSTTVTITGKVTNFNTSAAVSGVTFCARPSAGVTCVAPLDGSGNYSCTVPIGWAGVLHSPNVLGNRIPPQYFSAVTANTTRNVSALPGTPSCILDVDNNGLIEVDLDGVAILRRIAGFTAPAFAGLSGSCAANATPTAVFNATSPIANYNVTGGTTRLATDGAVLMRALLGLTGTAVTNGLGLAAEPGVTNSSWSSIQNWLASNCGVGF